MCVCVCGCMCVYIYMDSMVFYCNIFPRNLMSSHLISSHHESQLLRAELPLALARHWGAGISNRMKLHTYIICTDILLLFVFMTSYEAALPTSASL